MPPAVSVILPVYNGKRFLREAIESVLRQSFSDFELLLLDDGSTDGSSAIARSVSDPRMRTIRHETNQGLVATLNQGVSLARGAYIARMDADDIAEPKRIERQVAFLTAHPTVGVLGTWIRSFGNQRPTIWRYPVEHAAISARLLFGNPFAHPTVLLRREVVSDLPGPYNADYAHAEDYELWTRLSRRTRLANLDEALLRYRLHDKSVTQKQRASQLLVTRRIQEDQLKLLGVRATARELEVHSSVVGTGQARTVGLLEETAQWLFRLAHANRQTQRFDPITFRRELAVQWLAACEAGAALGIRAWQVYRAARALAADKGMYWPQAKLFIKSLMGSWA